RSRSRCCSARGASSWSAAVIAGMAVEMPRRIQGRNYRKGRCGMPKEFREGCLSFHYPEGWEMEREASDNGWTVSLYSKGTAFLILTLNNDFPDTDRMAETVLEVLQSEYTDVEADESSEPLAGQWA